MKHVFYIALSVFILGNLCHFGLPWWTIVLIGAWAGWFFPVLPVRSFGAAFAGGFLLWLGNAWLPDSANDGILSGRVGQLFSGLAGWHILLATGLLGGISAGLGALTGRLARGLFVGGKSKR